MRNTISNFLLLALSISIIFFACQQDNIDEVKEEDLDMMAATYLADDYLTTTNGRANVRKSITVIRFIDGQLYYKTEGSVSEYNIINEQTVTNEVKPGDYVFWYRGDGLSDLENIDFDKLSEEYLETMPDEINPDLMWVLKVPEDIDSTVVFLKYDIVYDYDGNLGPAIRLDPKLRLDGQDVNNSDDNTTHQVVD